MDDTQTTGQYLGQFTENAQNIRPHYVRAFVRQAVRAKLPTLQEDVLRLDVISLNLVCY